MTWDIDTNGAGSWDGPVNAEDNPLRVLLDIDFTALATQDLTSGGDGNKAVGGLTWNAINTGDAAVFDIHADGLRIEPAAATSFIWGGSGSRTAPHLKIENLTAKFGIGSVCGLFVKAYVDHADADAATEYVGFAIDDTEAASFHIAAALGHNGTTQILRTFRAGVIADDTDAVAASNVAAMQYGVGQCANVYFGAWTSGFPKMGDMTFSSRLGDDAAGATGNAFWSQPVDLSLFAANHNTGGNFTGIIKRLWVAVLQVPALP